MYFDKKGLVNKSTGDKYFIRLLQSPAIIASGISTIILPKNPNELGDGSNFYPPEEQDGNNFDIITEEIVAIYGKLIEYWNITTTQQRLLLHKWLN